MGAASFVFLVPLGFVVVGGVFVAFGVRAIRRRRAFARLAVRCPGVVVEMRTIAHHMHDGGSNVLYHPVLAFATREGLDVQTVSPYGTSPPSHRAGQRLDVLYDPRDPTRAEPANASLGTALNVGFIVFGAVFAGVGLVVGAIMVAVAAALGNG